LLALSGQEPPQAIWYCNLERPQNPMTLKGKPVLFVRENSLQNLWATDDQIALLRDRFPVHPLFTIANIHSNTAAILQQDSRFDKVIPYDPDGGFISYRWIAGFGRLVREYDVGVVVISVGTDVNIDYSPMVAALLLCTGTRYLLRSDCLLISAFQPQAFPVLLRAAIFLAMMPGRSLGSRLFNLYSRTFQSKIKNRALSSQDVSQMNRILWIRLDHIGDFIMSVPALRALRQRFPSAEIDVLTQSVNISILKSVPDIDDIIVFNPARYHGPGYIENGTVDLLTLVLRLRSKRYDLVLDPRGDELAREIGFLSGGRVRAGLYPGQMWTDEISGWASTLTHPVALSERRHTTENALELLKVLGIISGGETVRSLEVSDAAREATDDLMLHLGISAPFAIVHMHSRDPVRNWIPERMRDVVEYLVSRHKLTVVLTGGAGDRDSIDQMYMGRGASADVVNAAGKIPLETLPGLISTARIMVTIDTGPMHIAAALGVPVVALFFLRHATLFYPYGQRDRIIIADEDSAVVPHDADGVDSRPSFDKYSLLPLTSISTETVKRKIDNVMEQSTSQNRPRWAN
jgi:ADP-heptose:LPS heptosyltransferase